MDKAELVSGFLTELRRGTLILSVLAMLRHAAYGYQMITLLSTAGLSVEANTLYPLLRRLEGQGLLKSEWDTAGAKPRKYYRTTELGLEVLAELARHWQGTVQSLQTLLGGDLDGK